MKIESRFNPRDRITDGKDIWEVRYITYGWRGDKIEYVLWQYAKSGQKADKIWSPEENELRDYKLMEIKNEKQEKTS